MAAPYNNLLHRVEDALMAYIVANDAPDSDVAVYRSLDQAAITGQVAAPCYIIEAQKWTPLLGDTVPDQSGLAPFTVSVSIKARTMAEDKETGGITLETARERHGRLVGRLVDLFATGTVAADLIAQGIENLGIDQVDTPSGAFTIDGNHVETELTFDLIAYSKAG